MVLLFTLHHRNKENEPPQKVVENPYVTRKKVPAKSLMATSKALTSSSSQAPPLSKALPLSKATINSTSMASSSSLATIEEEPSPTIKRILEQTGCANRQELLARAAQAQVNTNRSQSDATNGSKAATATKGATNGSKSMSTNGSKSKSDGSKSTNGSKAMMNPKKKAKGNYFY